MSQDRSSGFAYFQDTPDRSSSDWPTANALPPACLDLEAGMEPVPGYRLIGRLGEGGSGEVWAAMGPGDFVVALKFTRLGRKDEAAQRSSLDVMRQVRHANLLTLFGAWQIDGYLVVGMERADRTLLDRFREATAAGDPGIPPAELVELMRQAAKGIDHLNRPRPVADGRIGGALLHGDIKPQNLLLVGDSVKVGDFGLVKSLEADASGSDTSCMTLIYAAPELILGQSSAGSDQYALAVTYCQLRSGRLPFDGGPAAIMDGHLSLPPDLTMLPERERPAVARALAKDPRERWPDCSGFVAALEEARATPRAAMAGPGPARVPGVGRLRRRVPAVAVAAGLLAASALVLAPVPPRTSPRPSSEPPRPAAPAFALDPGPASAVEPPSAPVETVAIVRPEPAAVEIPELAAIEIPEPAAEPPAPTPGPVPAEALAAARAEVAGAPRAEALAATRAEVLAMIRAIEAPGRRAWGRLSGIVAALREVRPAEDRRIEPSMVVGGLAPLEAPRLDPPSPAPPETPRRLAPDVDAEALGPSGPLTATIKVILPIAKAELAVRGEVGRGNPDEWYGPRRVIHTPPIDGPKDYLVGTFWLDPQGRPQTRSREGQVQPGCTYEVDLRPDVPTWKKLDREPPTPRPASALPHPRPLRSAHRPDTPR